MPFVTSMSTHPNAAAAVGEIVGDVLDQLGQEPRVILVFSSPHHGGALPLIVEALHKLLRPETLVGITAASVFGGSLDSGGGPAISIWAGTAKNSKALHIQRQTVADGLPLLNSSHDDLLATADALILLADPFSFTGDALVDEIADRYPRLKIVGGLTSGSPAPGGNRLVYDAQIANDGAVGLALTGVSAGVVVAQACEPIGIAMTVTAASGATLVEVATRPALSSLVSALEHLDPAEIPEAIKSVQLGVVADEHQAAPRASDFKMVDITGIDSTSRVIRLGEAIDVGTTVQFHLRSPASAAANVWRVLVDAEQTSPGSALVFASARRSERLFHEPNTDARAITEWLGGPFISGMTTMGEIGPAGRTSAIHEFAAAIAIFDDIDN